MSTQETGGAAPSNAVRNWLIASTLIVAAAIIFGLLYLFVIAPSIPNQNVGWFLFSFATGLTMIIMPCTLPLAFVIVPLSMGKGLVRGLGMALAFGLGIALTLSLYGIVAALLGNVALDALGVGLEGIKNWVYFVAGTFALVFALSEIGLLNIHMPTYTGAAPAFIQKRQEILKAFFLGLFLGNVGVGCPHPATPLILIEIASSGDVLYGWLLFLIHAIGRILPLLLLAFLAILGVNGLNWLMERKATLERVTGWAMVFVAGFILTLGLFSHDWWVNSGIHSALETFTQESKFNALINDTLGTNVAHLHGLETGEGLFGLPLGLGSYFLVLVWLIPIWWWYIRKRKALYASPAFKIQALEAEIDKLERDRRQIESTLNIDELEVTHDLKHTREEIDALEAKRREEEKKIEFGETGVLKNPVARSYEEKLLSVQRNYLVVVSIFLILVFVHYLPTNFYLKSMSGMGHGDTTGATHDHAASPTPTPAQANIQGTQFDTSIAGLPDAQGLQFVELNDGDTYSIVASYVKKEIGNRTYRMLAYNGSIPGPFIKVSQGTQVTINFTNNTDVDQTIHSHGIRIDNNFDGVPGSTQHAVKPGESYTYVVQFPDAGVAWYHPHTRDDYGQELGLYGNYIVSSLDENYWSPVNREVPLMVDDILVENNQIAAFYKEFTNHALLGRFGNTYLVNGETDYSLDVLKDEVVRLQITNTSNARTYRLTMPGASMKVVGGDLSRYEQEFFAEEIVISPAERTIIEVHFPKAGKVRLQNKMKNSVATIAEFDVSENGVSTSYVDEFNSARRDTDLAATFNEFRMYQDREPDKKLKLTVALSGSVDHSAHAHGASTADVQSHDMATHDHAGMMAAMMSQNPIDGIEWGETPTLDAVNTTENVEWILVDEKTGKKNMDIPISDWTFKQGQLVKMRITNDMMAAHVMQHPIHLHGQRFVVLSENGVPNKNMVWKDTALVTPGGYIDILVDMSNLGEWMLHCHIVEHLFSGMMMAFRVEDQSGNAIGDEFRKSLKPNQAATPGATTGIESFTYETPVSNEHLIELERQRYKVGKNENVIFTFKDSQGNGINLDQKRTQALRVWFVSRDGKDHFLSFPGNDVIYTRDSMMNSNVPNTPGFDESRPHMHSLNLPSLISVAYADVGHDHGGMAPANFVGSYTVPAYFAVQGDYKAFVEYYLEGDASPRIAAVTFTVGPGSWTYDSFGFSESGKWWSLLIISLAIMIPLSLWVRRYINSPIK